MGGKIYTSIAIVIIQQLRYVYMNCSVHHAGTTWLMIGLYLFLTHIIYVTGSHESRDS